MVALADMNNSRHPSGNSRNYFKGYLVKVADSGITFTRNYSPVGPRDANQPKNSIDYPANSLRRSASILPIVAYPKTTITDWNSNNSSNTHYSNQEPPPSSSHPPAGKSGPSADISRQMSSDDLRHLERKLEREREKRLHTEPPPPRLDTRVYGDSSPHMDFNARRNGFRPTSKNAFMTRNEQNMQLAAFRHGHNPMADPLSSLSIGPTPCPPGAPGTLRGQSIGFGSREGTMVSSLNASCGSSSSQGRAGNVKSRTRSIFLSGQSEKYRQNQYQFQDPALGAASDFQQRLAELTALETDTVRYERTKKAKKKAKQDSG
ncbi:uncharacterized protein [Diadema setosum]|uniref:uncharacterized protein isoform X2 n=1 Tax=Diadema setosum TaxID=31175 RepID=UPI003B3A9FC5